VQIQRRMLMPREETCCIPQTQVDSAPVDHNIGTEVVEHSPIVAESRRKSRATSLYLFLKLFP